MCLFQGAFLGEATWDLCKLNVLGYMVKVKLHVS